MINLTAIHCASRGTRNETARTTISMDSARFSGCSDIEFRITRANSIATVRDPEMFTGR